MSIVYPAVQPDTNRVVALKVLAPHLEHDRAAVERFRQEAQAAARLKQHNIVTIYEANTSNPPYYIAMEFLEGGTLADRLGNGPLKLEHALAIIRQISTGLDHAHRHRVVHRDIKPANVMFDAEGRVAITDFGISRVLDRANLTMAGTRTGTAENMSPEQARGEEVDFRSDLYSLGVVAYEMLTGRVPFASPQPLVTMRQIVDEPAPPPSAVNPAISPAVEAVLLKALEKDPRQRYQSGTEFSKALWDAYTGKDGKKDIPWREIALAGLLIAVLACIVSLVVRTIPSPPTPGTTTTKDKGSLKQGPIPAANAKKGGSKPGPKMANVPDLIHMQSKVARKKLDADNLSVGKTEYVSGQGLPKDEVVGQDPSPGEPVAEGKTVDLRLSDGTDISKVTPPPELKIMVWECQKSGNLPNPKRQCKRVQKRVAKNNIPREKCSSCPLRVRGSPLPPPPKPPSPPPPM